MKQVNNVFSWSLLKDELLYVDDKNNAFGLDHLKGDAPEVYGLSYRPTYLYQLQDNSFVIVEDNNRPSSVFREGKLLPFDIDHIGNIVIKEQDTRYLVLYDEEDGRSVYKVFDWVEKKELPMRAKRPYTIVKDQVFNIVNRVLHCYNLNGELRWTYNPADTYNDEDIKIQELIGLYDHVLWLRISNDHLLALDITNGSMLFAPMNLEATLGLPKSVIGDIHLDQKTGKIRILAHFYYIEIELATYTPAIKTKFEDKWTISKGKFYDGDPSVYFIGGDGKPKASISEILAGIFNTETLKIEWYFRLPDEEQYNFFKDRPQANEHYFGVKDNKGILYLLERPGGGSALH